jgi:hypothetical protein
MYVSDFIENYQAAVIMNEMETGIVIYVSFIHQAKQW